VCRPVTVSTLVRAVIREKLQSVANSAANVAATDAVTGGAEMLDVTAGNVLMFDEIKDRLKISHELVRRTFRKEPGVVKIGSTYRVPLSVYERVITRSLVAWAIRHKLAPRIHTLRGWRVNNAAL